MPLIKAILFICALMISHLAAAEDTSFRGLEKVMGTWKLSAPQSEDDKAFRLTYHLISKNTALVEVYGNPQRQTTQTLFHANGNALMATHYCARGNQPRLVAKESSDANAVTFEFLDVTNLSDKNDPHMVAMTFTFIDKDRFEKEEVYLVNGKQKSSTMLMVRDTEAAKQPAYKP